MQLLLTNKNNDTLDLLNSRNYFVLYKANALHGINTDISETESPFIDGTQIDSVRALPRSIELGFKIVGDVQRAINYFTSYVKSKQLITLEEITDNRDITIKGVATIPPYTRMLQSCEINLTVYCGQPYWEDAQTIIENLSIYYLDLLYFPVEGQYFTEYGRPFGALDSDVTKTFVNKSDTSVGMQIEIIALNTDIENLRISCESGNQVGWYLQINATLHPNDTVIINTVRGNKYITINGSNTYNGEPVINYLEFNGNDWLQLETGGNIFNASMEVGGVRVPATNAYFSIAYKGRYE